MSALMPRRDRIGKAEANTGLEAAIEAVRTGPQGPDILAVFDFGGTVVHGFTPQSAARRLLHRPDGRAALTDTLLTSIRGARAEGEYERFLQRIMSIWAGHSELELAELGTDLFRHTIYGHLYPEAWRLIRAHEAAGHTLVLATCLSRFQVEPAAAELGFAHVLYTPMAVHDDLLTGHVEGKPLWRNGKAEAVRRFAAVRGVELSRGYAYADAATDVPLLEAAGHATAVNPDPGMAIQARDRGWPMLTFRPRESAGALDIARTAAGFAGLLGGAAAGVAVASRTGGPSEAPPSGTASRTGRQRGMADSMITHAAAATLRTTGVRMRVTGAEYARAPRPAVFVFNHQSQFDMVVLAAVLGAGFTGIVKKEVTANPVFGPLLRFAGATFIDRSDSAGARAALAPVVQTLRSGLSIVIAPEGTRSLTPRVGPFKKGAFHIAQQAGVPVVPVVIRNAGEIAWRNSAIVRKGTVDVAVLPPIDVSGWNAADMTDEVERVRELFVRTLVDWPG
ncbi:HAD-IB family hydrolase [Nocardia albiluteola]|nr:HAD-IB family hydrolase [Nocardia albiluteola]